MVQMVVMVQVGAFVGQQRPPLTGVQVAKQAGGDDEAARSAGHGVGLRVGGAQNAEFAAGVW